MIIILKDIFLLLITNLAIKSELWFVIMKEVILIECLLCTINNLAL